MAAFGASCGASGVRGPAGVRARLQVVLVLLALCGRYLGSLLDCPSTCACSPTEIYCNKSDSSKFFPLSFQGTGSTGNSTGSIEDLFQNISSM
ncbi:NT-3 growth factor receptor [Liparis tanakae]|uniref:NT-3 growth factor receptor n=1 Tax=Liparis tanakae TaxID=230148 RepID=A0A4Z2E2U6_9TELE|nr:NT-3 growth factor receptor [Liparis tanakae]